jgi:outer membrane protein TolC
MRWRGWLLLICVICGCSRAYYRRDADRETYGAIAERNGPDPEWTVPNVSIDPPPPSRLHDPTDPDHPPLPPDDPAAARYMQSVNGMHGYRKWAKDGVLETIEDPGWRDYLQLSDEGSINLTPDRAVELGVLHSREYQTQLEQLYLPSLALTLDRFDFALHWFGTNNTFFEHSGSSATDSNTLTTNSHLGFTKAFAAGGQLLVDFANSFVFQFSHGYHMTTTSNLGITLLQPLLRNAGREVRLETLTEAERALLYSLRTFARFRKQFAVNLQTRSYLQLLLQVQSIRNQESNVKSLEQNLRLHEALEAAGQMSSVKVDQAFQSYQQGLFSLVQARAGFDTSLDQYKITIGLPPSQKVHVDDALLNPFQLTDPALDKLQAEMDAFFAYYRELDEAPPLAKLREGFDKLKTFQARMVTLVELVEKEIDGWKAQPVDPNADPAQSQREQADQKTLTRDLQEVRDDLKKLQKGIEKSATELAENHREADWEALQKWTRQQVAAAAELFVTETQVRVYLIKLPPIEWKLADATQYAAEHRLDLMNSRAQVTDAWRQITVTASALKAGLDVTVQANIATPPNGNNPVGFRASASNYQVGVFFDSPLNREAQRNAYRTSQIQYQQSRRSFMALGDSIQQAVQFDVRTLETETLNFGIARQSLIGAARAVESARQSLLVEKNTDPTKTQDVLTALQSLLQAKQALISSWVNYETGRVQLNLDLDVLQVDERGLIIDEHNPSEPSRVAESVAGGDQSR